MRFDIITIFPNMFDSYLNESIIKRAREKKLVDIRVHDLRTFSTDTKHRKVDDRPFGGGPGMVLKVEPIIRALEHILRAKSRFAGRNREVSLKNNSRRARTIKVIIFSAAGKQFNTNMSAQWAKKYNQIIMIAGRYEGIDERIFNALKTINYKLEPVSIGPYVLTGGELPAMVVIDAVSRHIPGVLGKEESLEEKRHGIGVPVYTRPDVFEYKGKKYRVPKELFSGNYTRIGEWRKKHGMNKSLTTKTE